MNCRLGLAVAIVGTAATLCRADDVAPPDPPPVVQVDAADVKGVTRQDVVKVPNARYFVWHDGQGWHARTASKNLIKFSGSIQLENGTFSKIRPIGLDKRDRWGVNKDRTEIRFEVRTGGSFDGFDFDVKRAGPEPTVTFDLKIGKNDLRYPKRIFLGRDSKNPAGARFECPADPNARKQPEVEGTSS